MVYKDYRNNVQREKKYDYSYLQLYDVTLRDGEQTPGVAYTREEKIYIAKLLNELGVRYIEAGFPGSGEEEAVAVKEIVDLNLDADIYALSRLSKKDIDLTYECGIRHLVLFCPGSDYLLNSNLKITEDEAIERIKSGIAYAKSKNMYVRFGCEDASRTSYDRLMKYYKASIESGVDMIAFADTLGVMTPLTTYQYISQIKQELNIPMAIHCHNDYGLGLANAISAIEAGVEQVHVSMNGLGERTGNVSLEELVTCMLIQYDTDLGIDMSKLYHCSQELYRIAGFDAPFNKPIVGRNNFTHESGLHVNGILSDKRTYQPFPAELIGRKNHIVLGKHSGASSVRYMLQKNNCETLSETSVNNILSKVKEMACNKKQVTNQDFLRLVNEEKELG